MIMDIVSSDRLTRWICNDVKSISIPSNPSCFRVDAKDVAEYARLTTEENTWYKKEYLNGVTFMYGYTNYRVIYHTDNVAKGFVLTTDGDVTHMVQAVQLGLGMEIV